MSNGNFDAFASRCRDRFLLLFTDSIFKKILKGIKKLSFMSQFHWVAYLEFSLLAITKDVKTSRVTEMLNITPIAHTNDKWMCAFSYPLTGNLAGSSYRKKKKVIRKPIHLFAWVQLLCVKEGYSQWETENWTFFQK
jgi:hypothetical protein